MAKHHKRTPQEIIHDRKVVWTLYNSHLSYGDIADFLNARDVGYTLSRSMIFKDVQAAKKQAVESLNLDKDEHIAQQLAKLDRMETEAWTEWERSKQELVNQEQTKKTIKEARVGQNGTSVLVTTGEKTNQKQVKKANLGMTKYMEVIKWCIQERNKLLALITTKVKQVGVDGEMEMQGGGSDAQVVLMLPDNNRDKVVTKPPTKAAPKKRPQARKKAKPTTNTTRTKRKAKVSGKSRTKKPINKPKK